MFWTACAPSSSTLANWSWSAPSAAFPVSDAGSIFFAGKADLKKTQCGAQPHDCVERDASQEREKTGERILSDRRRERQYRCPSEDADSDAHPECIVMRCDQELAPRQAKRDTERKQLTEQSPQKHRFQTGLNEDEHDLE